MRWTLDESELLPARTALVLASRIAGIEPPVDTPFLHIGKYGEALRRTTELARNLGFQGKLCIHPEQVAVVNAIFTPSQKEIAEAKEIVAAFESAEAGGSASIQVGGRFIDYPVVEQAKRVLDMAHRIHERR
jgi:citrate lyase subunit beta/citryl-CoA lyase